MVRWGDAAEGGGEAYVVLVSNQLCRELIFGHDCRLEAAGDAEGDAGGKRWRSSRVAPRWKLAMEAQRDSLQQLGGMSKERSHCDYCLEEELELLICQAGTSVCSGIEQTSLWKLVEAGRPRGNRRDTGTVAAQGDSTQPPLSKGGVPWTGGRSFSHMSPTI